MLERAIRASLTHNLTEGDDHIYAEDKARMSQYTVQVAGMERNDDDADYDDIARQPKAYAAILLNRYRLRAKQLVDKWLEECIEGSIGTLYK